MQESVVYQKILNRGISQGREEGLQQGLQQGMAHGERTLIIRQMSRKFGELEASLQKRVQELSNTKLGALGEALLDMRSPSDLEQWLAENINVSNT